MRRGKTTLGTRKISHCLEKTSVSEACSVSKERSRLKVISKETLVNKKHCYIFPSRTGRAHQPKRLYFNRWSEINAASSSASSLPSRVRSSLPLANRWVVG